MSSPISICLFGDICPSFGFYGKDGKRLDNIFQDFLPLIRQADYCVANLESPITDRADPLEKNSICIKSSAEDLGLLKKSGLSALAVANNHILDYGEKGLADTFSCAASLDMPLYGAGTLEQARQPHIVELKGKRIAFAAFAEEEFNCAEQGRTGANRWDDLESPDFLRDVKRHCDWLIVHYHGGIEHYPYPSPLLQRKCRKMAECGADFVACQHSHCVGTRERWHGAEILYGQGNSFFGWQKNDPGWNTGLVALLVLSDKLEVRYMPIEATERGEFLMASDGAAAILQKMEQRSARLSDQAFLQKEWDAFCQKQKDMYLPLLFGWNRYLNKLNRLSRGVLAKLLTTRSARMNVMNLIRCDAHREVLKTVFENEYAFRK